DVNWLRSECVQARDDTGHLQTQSRTESGLIPVLGRRSDSLFCPSAFCPNAEARPADRASDISGGSGAPPSHNCLTPPTQRVRMGGRWLRRGWLPQEKPAPALRAYCWLLRKSKQAVFALNRCALEIGAHLKALRSPTARAVSAVLAKARENAGLTQRQLAVRIRRP